MLLLVSSGTRIVAVAVVGLASLKCTGGKSSFHILLTITLGLLGIPIAYLSMLGKLVLAVGSELNRKGDGLHT